MLSSQTKATTAPARRLGSAWHREARPSPSTAFRAWRTTRACRTRTSRLSLPRLAVTRLTSAHAALSSFVGFLGEHLFIRTARALKAGDESKSASILVAAAACRSKADPRVPFCPTPSHDQLHGRRSVPRAVKDAGDQVQLRLRLRAVRAGAAELPRAARGARRGPLPARRPEPDARAVGRLFARRIRANV